MTEPVLLASGEGETNHERFRIKSGLERLVVTEVDHTPGLFEPPPHVHYTHSDAFYVLEGEMGFRVGEEEHVLGPNEFVFAPPELVHCYHSPGSTRARMLNIHAPGMRFERYLLGDRSFQFDQHPPPAGGGRPATDGRVGRVGEQLDLGPAKALILAGVDDGIGSMAVVEVVAEPGFPGPPPHVHDETVDSFYVLEGVVELRLGDETVDAGPGSFALVPPGHVHSVSNRGDAPARLLNIQAPGGLERYLRELAKAGASAADPAFMAQVAAKFDIRVA
jgi:mannose-6-phosphate isomerase-like protein (cupin superfamily)